MKYVRYSKYAPGAADDIDLQELMSRLSDYLLQSGFESQYGIYEMDSERSREQIMDDLREAILHALQESELVAKPGVARPDQANHPAHGSGRLHFAAEPDSTGHAASHGNTWWPSWRTAASHGSPI